MKRSRVVIIFLLGSLASQIIAAQIISTVTPTSTGYPNSVAVLWPYEFVSVQGTGQIYTYSLSSGSQVLVGAPYGTTCTDPSGMVITNIAGVNVMAVTCYDTESLLTFTVNSNGSLTALGSVSGFSSQPYPGIALDGTNVLVPLFGTSESANGGVAIVSIASPAYPSILGTVSLASPTSGVFVNPGFLSVAGGYIYVAAGSEPDAATSTIQVVNESTLSLVGSPFAVAHSPQQIVIQGSVAYITVYDSQQLESINISNPANLSYLQTLTLTSLPCNALPIIVRNSYLYVGCYNQSTIYRYDISNPSDMQLTQQITGVTAPQRFKFAGQYLLATGSNLGGSVYQINTGADYQQQIAATDIYGTSIQANMLNASTESITNNLNVQGAAYLGSGSSVDGSPICTTANGLCAGGGAAITALTGDVVASGPGSSTATVTGVHATSGTLNGVSIGSTLPSLGNFSNLSTQAFTLTNNQNAYTNATISNANSGSSAQAIYFANSDTASFVMGATSSTFTAGLANSAYINAHAGSNFNFLFHDQIIASFNAAGFNVGSSNQFNVDPYGNITANSETVKGLSVSDTQNGYTNATVSNASSASSAQAIYFANSDTASFVMGATSSTFVAGLANSAYINAHAGSNFYFLFHDQIVASLNASGLSIGSSSQFQVDESGDLTGSQATFSGTVTEPQVLGPASAPTGSCSTNGAWVFSQDGEASFCSSGTWVRKI